MSDYAARLVWKSFRPLAKRNYRSITLAGPVAILFIMAVWITLVVVGFALETDNEKENALLNNIRHASFYTGDVINICNDDFFSRHGKPDVIITDPPRAGMHEKLVRKLLDIAAPVIVYVSCNSATQARDLHLLDEKYVVEKIQPVDMFPHTHHIENVVQLKLKNDLQKNLNS